MNPTEEFKHMAIRIMLNASDDLRRKLRELSFTPNAVRHIEKNVLSFLTDKEFNAELQDALDKIPIY